MQPIGECRHTLLAVREFSGESFVLRNVGLKACGKAAVARPGYLHGS